MKFIIITGGVISSVGKGVAAAVISAILKGAGYKTRIKKFDPYFNVNPGTLSPEQHGEVYVTSDGAETDLDLGHYERIGQVEVSANDYTTMGSIMNEIIRGERAGEFLGKTVQVIPHITNAIKNRFYTGITDEDVVICEIGGTVGDIESLPFLEAARQLGNKAIFLHVSYLLRLPLTKEIKTKPTQHSVSQLRSYGINPDILACRNDFEVERAILDKLSQMCGVSRSRVISFPDAIGSLYHLPEQYTKSGLYKALCDALGFPERQCILPEHKVLLETSKKKIFIVTKYNTSDAYRSLEEALAHSYAKFKLKANLIFIDSENIQSLEYADGIIIPGGFGSRGVEGKLKAIAYAVDNKIPFLGICLGMQLAVIDGLRRIGINADSAEFNQSTIDPAICLVKKWTENGMEKIGVIDQIGDTLRVGDHKSTIKLGSVVHKLYGAQSIIRRHRHRYEVNPQYESALDKAGIHISGRSSEGLIEIVERPDHPFFVAAQYHPEFSSRLESPEQMISGFVEAVENTIITRSATRSKL